MAVEFFRKSEGKGNGTQIEVQTFEKHLEGEPKLLEGLSTKSPGGYALHRLSKAYNEATDGRVLRDDFPGSYAAFADILQSGRQDHVLTRQPVAVESISPDRLLKLMSTEAQRR